MRAIKTELTINIITYGEPVTEDQINVLRDIISDYLSLDKDKDIIEIESDDEVVVV